MDRRVEEILSFMRDNIHLRLSVDEMARRVSVSPSRLRQIFREETGTSPVRYLRKLRMARAKELLESTFLSVKEVAAKAGLNSISHFVTNFENTFGRSPSAYRAARSGKAARTSARPRSSRKGQ